MNANAIAQLALVAPALASKLAKAQEVKAPKAEAKAKTKKGCSREEIAAHNAKSGNAKAQDTFGTYRPEGGRELSPDAVLIQYGTAGHDAEQIKMLDSIRAVVKLVSDDLDCQLANDSEFVSFLASEGETIESLRQLVRRFDSLSRLCQKLESQGEFAKALPFAEEHILTAGRLHKLCGSLYAKAGEQDVIVEETLAGEAGSFGAAVKTPEGFVALFEGDAYVLPEDGEGTAWRKKTRRAMREFEGAE